MAAPVGIVEDFPRAAIRHNKDALAMLDGGRWDGAGYLSGYVVECSIKAVLERANASVPRGSNGHIPNLDAQVTPDAQSRVSVWLARARVGRKETSRYLGVIRSRNYSGLYAWWCTGRRYEAPNLSEATARRFQREAQNVMQATVHKMVRDGLLKHSEVL